MNDKKLSIRIIVMLMALALFICACQPTPDKPIVNAGDDTELNDKIESTPIPTPEAPEENLTTIYNFPTEQKDEFECTDPAVSVKVDAEVIVPNAQTVPVVRVEPTIITPEFVKNFTEAMHPDVTFYDKKDVMSKTEVEKWVNYYQERASIPWEEFPEYYLNATGIDDEEDARQYYQQCQYSLKEYKKLLAEMPENYEQQPTDFTYHDNFGYYIFMRPEFMFSQNYYGDTLDDLNHGVERMIMTGTTDESWCIYIEAEARPDRDITSSFTYILGTEMDIDGYRPVWQWVSVGAMTFSEFQAINLGNETIKKMGLDRAMALSRISAFTESGRPTSSASGKVNTYVLKYHRGFDGLFGGNVDIKNEYAYVSGNEVVTITIQSDTVIKIEYENPQEVVEVENENVGLIAFEQAYEAFKKQAKLEYTLLAASGFGEYIGDTLVVDESVKGCNITINKIQLVMVKIPIRDGGYHYVPAWQFSGTKLVRLKNGYSETLGGMIFMTINAVDGTRIEGINSTEALRIDLK
ncbi:MAG: hypothetical protein J1E60_06650 [Christensenellaceae bacterium]|nr:hypothetical protein [Christensenellaceae bacterium]